MKKSHKTLLAVSLGLIFSLSSLTPQLHTVKQSNSSNSIEQTTTTLFKTNNAEAKKKKKKKKLKNTNKHNCIQLAGKNQVCLTP